jgi:hypothetical protein
MRQMAPDLLLHLVFDEAEALAGMPHREVVHPPPEHRIDRVYHPFNRLRPVSAEHLFERPHQRRPLFEPRPASHVACRRRSRSPDRQRTVNKHRSGTPGLREGQPIDLVRELGGGPNRRRSGPHPERISSCYIKALRSSELGSRFGAFSQDMLRRPKVF